MVRTRIVTAESIQHRFDDMLCLVFQVFAAHIRPSLAVELDISMKRLASVPTEPYQLRFRRESQARVHEPVADERKVVPRGEILPLLPAIPHFVEQVPPIVDQPLCDAEHGNDDLVPLQAAVVAVNDLRDNGIANFDVEFRHRELRENVR